MGRKSSEFIEPAVLAVTRYACLREETRMWQLGV
jgi:hypothetical protein